jgi:hypothetical protein
LAVSHIWGRSWTELGEAGRSWASWAKLVKDGRSWAKLGAQRAPRRERGRRAWLAGGGGYAVAGREHTAQRTSRLGAVAASVPSLELEQNSLKMRSCSEAVTPRVGHEGKLSEDEMQEAPRSLRVWRPPKCTRRAAIRPRVPSLEIAFSDYALCTMDSGLWKSRLARLSLVAPRVFDLKMLGGGVVSERTTIGGKL